MRCTAILSAATKSKQSMRTVALNVHFKHPDLGMKKHEILSRATAFLLSVDPRPTDQQQDPQSSTPYTHLTESRNRREEISHQQDYAYTPAGGPRRDASELNWLEFCPGKFRPLVHVVASSHVLSPWMWKKYYPQPWLERISQEHVTYSVGVYGTGEEEGDGPLATFALNPYPVHHPEGMDLAMAHLKQEESALETMRGLGVEVLHLTDPGRSFERDDTVFFEGFEIAEEHADALSGGAGGDGKKGGAPDDDIRVFLPYTNTGNLTFASQTRYLASTETPLPEGLCGGPVIDTDGNVCGIVEGIVPKDHEDEKMAGSASFIPNVRLREFTDFAERNILERILPKALFKKVVHIKEGNALNDGESSIDFSQAESEEDRAEGVQMDAVYDDMVRDMKKANTPEQIDAILNTVEREKQEVIDTLEREGGDLDEVIAKVRTRTRERQAELIQKINDNTVQDAEIVPVDKSKS